jgi:DNA primase
VRDAQLSRLIADAMASVRRVQNDPDADPTDLRERTMALHRLELERVALREGVSS